MQRLDYLSRHYQRSSKSDMVRVLIKRAYDALMKRKENEGKRD